MCSKRISPFSKPCKNQVCFPIPTLSVLSFLHIKHCDPSVGKASTKSQSNSFLNHISKLRRRGNLIPPQPGHIRRARQTRAVVASLIMIHLLSVKDNKKLGGTNDEGFTVSSRSSSTYKKLTLLEASLDNGSIKFRASCSCKKN